MKNQVSKSGDSYPNCLVNLPEYQSTLKAFVAGDNFVQTGGKKADQLVPSNELEDWKPVYFEFKCVLAGFICKPRFPAREHTACGMLQN